MVTIKCLCPPRADGAPRHPDGDEITLRDRLDYEGGEAARKRVAFIRLEDPEAGPAEVLAALSKVYLLYGISEWTLVQQDDKGKVSPLPVTRPNIRLLLESITDTEANTLADAADERYSEQVVTPLVLAASKSSPPGPTAESTSAMTSSSSSSPTPSSPSLTSTTPTAGTATISRLPAGGSRSSRKSGTAA